MRNDGVSGAGSEARVDVKKAVRTAAAYVAELFDEEGVQHIGLEEVTFDDKNDVWNVTIGFFRELDRLRGLAAAVGSASGNDVPGWRKRTFKIVSIDNRTGAVLSLTHRSLPAGE